MRILEATAKRVLFPERTELVPAYYVEMLGRASDSNVNQARAYVIGAKDGRVFYDMSLTHDDGVHLPRLGRPAGNHIPTDGPFVDARPTHRHAQRREAHIPSAHPRADGRVQQEPDGQRPTPGSPPTRRRPSATTSTPTATATTTSTARAPRRLRRRHRHPRRRHRARRRSTAPTTPRAQPNSTPDQIKAAITQLFYIDNWLHDYWYDSGFDEAAGNAPGEQLRARRQKATRSTPRRRTARDAASEQRQHVARSADGQSPRMQMYVLERHPASRRHHRQHRRRPRMGALPAPSSGLLRGLHRATA